MRDLDFRVENEQQRQRPREEELEVREHYQFNDASMRADFAAARERRREQREGKRP